MQRIYIHYHIYIPFAWNTSAPTKKKFNYNIPRLVIRHFIRVHLQSNVNHLVN